MASTSMGFECVDAVGAQGGEGSLAFPLRGPVEVSPMDKVFAADDRQGTVARRQRLSSAISNSIISFLCLGLPRTGGSNRMMELRV